MYVERYRTINVLFLICIISLGGGNLDFITQSLIQTNNNTTERSSSFKSNKDNEELDRTPKAPSEQRKTEEKSNLLDSSQFSSFPLNAKIVDESLVSLQSHFDKSLLPMADYRGLSTLIDGTSNVYSVSSSPNTDVIATGFSNGSVILLNLTTKTVNSLLFDKEQFVKYNLSEYVGVTVVT